MTPRQGVKRQEDRLQWVCDTGLRILIGLIPLLGFLDQTLYTGEIEFTDIPAGQELYWILPMNCAYAMAALSVTS